MCSCGLMMNPYGALPTAFGGMRGEARWNAAYHFRDNRVGTSKRTVSETVNSSHAR